MGAPEDPILFETGSPEETMELGARLGAVLRPGDLVLLRGDLGSGKTVFVRGVCRAFGCADRVRSPSFVLVREYEGRVRVFHVDLYRLTGPGDWPNLGVEDRMAQGVALVEWGERIAGLYGGNALDVEIRSGRSETDRVIALRWSDPRLAHLGGAR
ncbi:MAG: tRNA (adenosine(37)-N6)-threonylcarbamoyltransferase complex ATPase subunit type 1 TsaE [Candidatus Eisenbacteria bacterium]|nr:tRNA (adenosine(37)-N6)-threonylcarbamoyltransferase complex ATPase subunit type 1 TsaE [Candidatus Eisenbacteria bacterium]